MRARLGLSILLVWLLGVVVALDATLIEPCRVVVEEVHVPIAGLPADLHGLRIAQVADLHMVEIDTREAKAARLINELQPDMIVVTGDLMRHTVLLDVQERWAATVSSWLSSLDAPPLGIWVTRGNSDISRYGDFNNVFMEQVEQAGVQTLINESMPVTVNNATLWLAGVDYAEFSRGFVSDFEVQSDAGQQWIATGRSEGNSTLHLWTDEALAWRNYEFSGRFMRESEDGGIGITFYSQFPAGYDRYYRLRNFAERPSLHISPHGATISSGTTDTGVTPAPGQWYRFRVQVATERASTHIRARVWPDGEGEPTVWQADCTDDSQPRLSAGSVGLWGLDAGRKQFDDLVVRGVGAPAPAWLEEDFDAYAVGEKPIGWLAYGKNGGNVDVALAQAPADGTTILLAHSPDQVLDATGKGVDLVLSGHTHGGQVRLPFIGTVYAGTKLGPKYAAGLFAFDDVWLYVTRGVGMTGLPIRFLCPPEVSLLILEQAGP
jgi:predicted MPP superfamily phosphohydrolase